MVGGAVGLCGVEAEGLAGVVGEGEGLVFEGELADEGVAVELGAVGVFEYIAVGPPLAEALVPHAQFADQFGQARIVRVAAGVETQSGRGAAGGRLPGGEDVVGGGVQDAQRSGPYPRGRCGAHPVWVWPGGTGGGRSAGSGLRSRATAEHGGGGVQQSWHPASAGMRGQPGLAGSDPRPAGTKEVARVQIGSALR
ncbi:hypothetical protein CQW39_30710 [Streptomyces griseofuscus]|nr:hypothetical protein CQW39_30710 [Streptomyces griseofuscus]